MGKKTYWLRTITPLHVGSGRGIGYVDLPIVREKTTNWPYVPGSSIKGVILEYCRNLNPPIGTDVINAAFGKAGADPNSNAGSLVFSDAMIVCLPVRSFYGTFAWVTSPFVLSRLGGVPSASGIQVQAINDSFIAVQNGAGGMEVNYKAAAFENSVIAHDGRVFLEDLDLGIATDHKNQVEGIGNDLANNLFPCDPGWQEIFKKRFVIVHDDLFTFLSETGTEVAARIKINANKKTAAAGGLWYEESLPVETILAGTVWCDKVFSGSGISEPQLFQAVCNPCELQIGGKASIGKGRVKCLFS